MVKVDDVRLLALVLPRAYEVLVRDRIKFRVGRIVRLAFSRDERLMGFAFPKVERDSLIASDPIKFQLPQPSDLRYNWVVADTVIVLPLSLLAVTAQQSFAGSSTAPVSTCRQLTPVTPGPTPWKNTDTKFGRKRPPHVQPVITPASTIAPKAPTTFPAPFTKAEMDAAEARGKAMQKQMMDRKIAEDAKNTAPPVRAKVAQALTKEDCIPIPITEFGPGPTTSLPPPSTK